MFAAALTRRNFHFAGAPRASGLESHLHVDPLDTRATPWRNADSVQRLSLKQAIAESLCERSLLRRKVMLFPQDVTATQHPRNIGPDWEFGASAQARSSFSALMNILATVGTLPLLGKSVRLSSQI
jgi:hypothetical protein